MLTTKAFKSAVLPALLLFLVLGVAVVTAGCGSSGTSSAPSGTTSAGTSAAASTPAPQSFTMQVLTSKMGQKAGYLGPDGNGHDTFMLTGLPSAQLKDLQARSTLDVKVGQTVTVTVTNYDEGPHTFTVPDLGVNATVNPATNPTKGIPSKTTFTFVAKKAGAFRWFCTTPCDAKHKSWAMSMGSPGNPDQVGYMAGQVVVS